MPTDAPARFRSRLADLSGPELEAFVTALWEARGYAVDRVETGFRVRRSPDEPPTSLFVLGSSGEAVPSGTDVVVAVQGSAPDVSSGVTVVDADDLFEMSVFAVETAESRRLWKHHLQLSPPALGDAPDDSGAAPPADTSGDTEAAVDEGESDTRATGASAEPPAATESDPVDSPTAGSAAGEDAWAGRFSRRGALVAGGAALAGLGVLAAAGRPADTEPEIPVEGLDRDGVQNPMVLAKTHGTAIEETSYSLALRSLRSGDGGGLLSYLSMDLRVTRDRAYLTRVSTAGPRAPRFLGTPPATAVYWSDGETYVVDRSTDETEGFREFVPPNRFVGTWKYWAHAVPFGGSLTSHPTTYFERVFDEVPTRFVERTTVGESTRYRVANAGEPSSPGSSLGLADVGNARDVRLDASIDEAGVIRTLDLSFTGDASGDPVAVARTLRYESIGSTAVDDPRG